MFSAHEGRKRVKNGRMIRKINVCQYEISAKNGNIFLNICICFLSLLSPSTEVFQPPEDRIYDEGLRGHLARRYEVITFH